MTVELLVEARARLGECPLWCDRTPALFWTDIEGRTVSLWTEAAQTVRTWTLPRRVGSFALCTQPDHAHPVACIAADLPFVRRQRTRSGEVRFATWPEIDFKSRAWTVPAERMKSGREHRVPLNPAAILLLESIPLVASVAREVAEMALAQMLKVRPRRSRVATVREALVAAEEARTVHP